MPLIMTSFVSGTFREQLPKSIEGKEDILRLALQGLPFPRITFYQRLNN